MDEHKLNPKMYTTMDEHKHKILVILVFSMAMQHVITIIVILQQLGVHQHYSVMMMMVVFIMEANGVVREIFMEL